VEAPQAGKALSSRTVWPGGGSKTSPLTSRGFPHHPLFSVEEKKRRIRIY
jgi:hypothetical protein